MKNIMTIALFLLAFGANAQDKKITKPQVVEASCGQCNFGMKDKKGCDLAVKIDGKPYFVDGVNMDDHGDAHAADGFCSKVRSAEVTGEVKDNRFVASSFKLLPEKKTKKAKKK